MKATARFLGAHPFYRHLFFLFLAILAILISGYHFGTFDQVIHITFLKEFFNPKLFSNDPFLTLRWYHFSFFWFPFIPLYKIGILQISMFIIHIGTVYGTIWMFWALSNLLFEKNEINLLVILAVTIPHMGFPGFQIIEFSLLNRTFALPFILGSIWFYLRERKILAFFLLGLMFNIHVLYAAFVLTMFLLSDILTLEKSKWWKPIPHFSAFLLASLPVLIWRMQTGNGIDLTLRAEMLDIASRGLLNTIYYPISPSGMSINNLIAGIGTFWGFGLGYHISPKTRVHKHMRNFTYAILILLFVATITSYLLPITILVQMQIYRAGVFMLYFSMLYLGYFIYKQFENGLLTQGGFFTLGIGFILFLYPLSTIILWYLIRFFKKQNWNQGWLSPFVVVVQILTMIIGFQSGFWRPGLFIYGPDTAWRDVQEWAKETTPIDTKFITPPHLFGQYIPDWRVFSERSSVVTIPEMMEIPFDPDFMNSFLERFNAVVPGAIEKFNGNYLDTLKITANQFYMNSKDDFSYLGCQYSALYLVVEENHPYDFDTVYKNGKYIVYSLPPCP